MKSVEGHYASSITRNTSCSYPSLLTDSLEIILGEIAFIIHCSVWIRISRIIALITKGIFIYLFLLPGTRINRYTRLEYRFVRNSFALIDNARRFNHHKSWRFYASPGAQGVDFIDHLWRQWKDTEITMKFTRSNSAAQTDRINYYIKFLM